ncbi:MAG: hypothetical protein ABGF52_02770 [Candidatus Asgardarchaeum sp.]
MNDNGKNNNISHHHRYFKSSIFGFIGKYFQIMSTIAIFFISIFLTTLVALPIYFPLLATIIYILSLKLFSYGLSLRSGKLPAIIAPAYKIEVLVKCTNCEYKEIRKYERGYYVFKQLEKCPSCKNGQLYIHSIYGIPLQPSEEELEEEKI